MPIISIIIPLCYCYFISSKIPKGIPRLISLLPIFYFFTIFPLRFKSAFITAITALFITWLANFKLLLFAFDQGPLTLSTPSYDSTRLSLPLFIAMAALPIRTKKVNIFRIIQPKPTIQIPLYFVSESVILAIVLELLFRYRSRVHQNLVLACYGVVIFLLIDVLVSVLNFYVRVFVGLELELASDKPYFATSLQDFWGRRWNLTVTNTLRHTVYISVKITWTNVIGEKWAPLVGVLVTFVVSGLMHELIFYYVTRASPTWEMTLYFTLQGLGVVVEFGVKRALKDRWRLPCGPLAVGFVMVTGWVLFFPPLIRNGADARVIEELEVFFDFVKKEMFQVVRYLYNQALCPSVVRTLVKL